MASHHTLYAETRMVSNVWLVAAAWMGLALAASVISVRIGISVALIEIVVGIIAGNFFGLHVAPHSGSCSRTSTAGWRCSSP